MSHHEPRGPARADRTASPTRGGPDGFAWTEADAAVLAQADYAADRYAAWVRLAAAAAIGATLFGAIQLTRPNWSSWLVIVVLVDLAIACGAIYLTRTQRLRASVPWLLSMLDAAFLFGVGWFNPWFERLPQGYRAALVSPYLAFLLIALAAVRPRASTILFQTGLLTLSFSLVIWWPLHAAGPLAPQSESFERLFSVESNLIRVAIVIATGAVLAAAANRSRAALKRAIRNAREGAALRRFVPAEIGAVLTATEPQVLRRGDRHRIVALFIDIRGFTALSEDADPGDVVDLLNAFRDRTGRVMDRHGGVIDKFIGDAVLVVFGLLAPRPDDAERGMAAITDLVDAVNGWNTERAREGQEPVRIGIGAHVGEAFVGALGDGRRLEFTVIGDAVNVAQRLEALTRTLDADAIVSAELFVASGRSEGEVAGWHRHAAVELKGRASAIDILVLRGRPTPPAAEATGQSMSSTTSAPP